jgi:hypothetical protein
MISNRRGNKILAAAMAGIAHHRPLKRVASKQTQATRFKLLFLRMSLSRNRFPLSGDMH